MIQLTDFA